MARRGLVADDAKVNAATVMKVGEDMLEMIVRHDMWSTLTKMKESERKSERRETAMDIEV